MWMRRGIFGVWSLKQKKKSLPFRLIVLALAAFYPAGAEEVRGVLWSVDHGLGANPAGGLELAVEGRVLQVYFSPNWLVFKIRKCYQIGAVWNATLRRLDGSWTLDKATCNGETDAAVSSAWSTVRDYVESLGTKAPGPASLFSAKWLASEAAWRWKSTEKNLLPREFAALGEKGNCLEVMGVRRPSRVRIGGGSCIVDGPPQLFYVFDVVRNAKTRRWEIDAIEILTLDAYREAGRHVSRPPTR